ncbi:MAG TPA: Ig-like domain-containing protein [Longimicrobiaceae bacterium]|nr:Ig-like domain-containing protein [Longimicrobiaceae bacterium]
MRHRLLLPVVLTCVSLAGACSDGPSGPTRAASVEIRENGKAVSELTLAVGQTDQLTAVALDAAGAPLADRAITWTSTNTAVATVTPAGLVTGAGAGDARVVAEADGRADTVAVHVVAPVAACTDAQTPLTLDVGEVRTFSGAQAAGLCVGGGASGAEYAYIPFNASDARITTLLEVNGSGIGPAIGPPSPSRAAAVASALRLGAGPTAVARSRRPADGGFEARLRERERRLGYLAPAAWAARSGPRRSVAPAAAPVVGSLLRLNVNTEQPCISPSYRTGRVEAVGQKALIVSDTLNPKNGFTAADFQRVAAAFDTLIYPVITDNFGTPTDIDQNGHVIIFYTTAVNALTPANADFIVGGFFYGRDLFPTTNQPGFQGCEGSNYAEMFYMLAPDPEGTVNGNKRSRDDVYDETLGVVAHEFQHLISASRRLYIVNTANYSEEAWLNEGLSHIAEELMFYHTSGLAPRQDIGIDAFRQSDRAWNAFLEYQLSNTFRYVRYLEQPQEESLFGIDPEDSELTTRGAAWSFLRYAADRRAGSDRELWKKLIDSSLLGVQNLNQALGASTIDWVQDWTVSVYADDAVATQARFQQPSWDYRSILLGLVNGSTREPIWPQYPLKTLAVQEGTPISLTLKGGGAAYLRFGVGAGGRALLRATSGGTVPPERVRISIVRTK